MPQTLEEGLDRSANKRGLTGKERHRYIGGALRNMAKRGAITLRTRSGKAVPKSAIHHAHAAPSPAPAPVAKPAKKAYSSPTLLKRERLELEVKQSKTHKGADGSARFIIVNKKTGAQHGGGIYRTRKAATNEAKIEMDAHNHPLGKHERGRLV